MKRKQMLILQNLILWGQYFPSKQFHKFKTNSTLGNIYVQNLDLHPLSNLGSVVRINCCLTRLVKSGFSKTVLCNNIPQVFLLIVPSCWSESDHSGCEWIHFEGFDRLDIEKYLPYSHIDKCSKMCDVGHSEISIGNTFQLGTSWDLSWKSSS